MVRRGDNINQRGRIAMKDEGRERERSVLNPV